MIDSRIHILGASCTGTTTLGERLGARLSIKHLDTDDFYWKSTAVRFSEKRSVKERLSMIQSTTDGLGSWVLSGSLCSWGGPLIPRFTHVIFVQVPWAIRESRLRARELERYGQDALSTPSEQQAISRAFLEWASLYDTAGLEQRSLQTHEHWIKGLPDDIPVLRIDGTQPVEDLIELVVASLD